MLGFGAFLGCSGKNNFNQKGKMKKAKRWRYYCDYCKKSGGSAYHMKKHEKSCTGNPKRTCGFCEIVGFDNNSVKLKKIVADGLKRIEKVFSESHFLLHDKADEISEQIIKDLHAESGGCPACMLAAIRQTKDNEFLSFDYKKTKDEFWADHNESINDFC